MRFSLFGLCSCSILIDRDRNYLFYAQTRLVNADSGVTVLVICLTVFWSFFCKNERVHLGASSGNLWPTWGWKSETYDFPWVFYGFGLHLGGILGSLGAILGKSWGHLVAILGNLEQSWGLLGPFWKRLGKLGAIFGSSWGLFGPALADLGPTWSHLGPSSGFLGPS